MTLDILKVVAVIVGEIIVGIAGAYVTVRQLRSNIRKNNAESEAALGNAIKDTGDTLEAAWNELRSLKKELEESKKKIEELDKELIRYMRALNKSIRFISDRMPGVEVPDFLKETDPSISKKK